MTVKGSLALDPAPGCVRETGVLYRPAPRETVTIAALMTVAEFIGKWRDHELKERSAAQEHFIDLCRLVGHPTPAEADRIGESFTFERGAAKATGGEGWADVWKKECFGWEYKGKAKDLDTAYVQLLKYQGALENPPLLVTCETDRIVVHTCAAGDMSNKLVRGHG